MISEIEQLIQQGRMADACEAVKKGIRDRINFEGRHVRYASLLILNGHLAEISLLLPKDTNFFTTSGWLNSVANAKPVNAQNAPIPWLTYPAIDFLDTVVKPSWNVFEWGSGNSTLWWAGKVASVCAVESDRTWFDIVSPQLPQNAAIVLKETQHDYVNHVDTFNDAFFDVIVVDGEYRNECSLACLSKLKQGGIVIFDNSDGADWDASMVHFTEAGYYRLDFWGLIPSYAYKNCTSVFFKDPSILKSLPPPSQHASSVGISCFQSGRRG